MKFIHKNWLWILINIIAILPLIGLIASVDIGFTANGLPELSVLAPPSRGGDLHEAQTGLGFMTLMTGEWAMRFLVLSLTCTPIFILSRWPKILSIKKITGLWAFVYSLLHLVVFVADKGWWATFEQANFVMGLISLLIMVPLALTSHKWWMQQLRKNWKILHRAAYMAGIFAILHLAFLGEGVAILQIFIIGGGLLLRLPHIRRAVARWHTGSKHLLKPSFSSSRLVFVSKLLRKGN